MVSDRKKTAILVAIIIAMAAAFGVIVSLIAQNAANIPS
jgi:hypothetical protein